MRADPDKNEELDTEVVSSRQVIRTSSPPVSSTPPSGAAGRCQSPVSNHTPLLTATLNAPPQSYYGGLNGNVRVKCPTDMSISITTKNKKSDPDTQYSDSPSQGLSNNQSSHHQAVFYSTLLKQLRQKAGDGPSSGSGSGQQQQIHVVPVKIKKEKGSASSKSLPFMCPACKKRFQRHIAMNAHFQNEHISAASSSGERSCKLCGITAASLSMVRNHLRTAHNIDLDNPAKCLVEDPTSFSSSKYSLLEASLRSGSSTEETEPSCSNIDMSESSRSSSPQPAHSYTPSSSEQSPERSLFPIKQHVADQDDDNSQVEDLSLRRHVPRSPVMGRSAASVECYSPRSESPMSMSSGSKPSKRPRLRESQSPSPTFGQASSQPASPPPLGKYVCNFCNISYPNQTLYFLHKGFHSDANPWRCNGCGHQTSDLYEFNSHLFSAAHQ